MKTRGQRRADEQLRKKTHELLTGLYAATSLALWQDWGWRTQKILNIFRDSEDLWMDLTVRMKDDPKLIPLRVLEDETGIELRLSGDKSWHEMKFLTGEFVDVDPALYAQAYMYMRLHQAEWTRAQILASIFICLHRRYGFGAERLGRLMDQITELEANMKPKELVKVSREVTGIVAEKEIHLT